MLSILREDGSVAKDREPPLKDDDLRGIFRTMLLVRTLDERCMNLQRQGRVAFYGTATGEEAAVVGSAAALARDDLVFPALRQGGVLLHRGWPLERYFAHLFGTADAVEKGRSMPCHYSDGEFGVFSWSSSMATQLPHAVGWAYGEKLRAPAEGRAALRVAMAYLGDGATSEGDFHVAANFAGVWKVPTVFFCHNNQWAISVPFAKQSATWVHEKAKAYGFPGVQVDGNDVLACYVAAKEAVDRARRGDGPTLVEAVTYRMRGHSSSDDPTRYRDAAEVEAWARRDPLIRLRTYLGARGVWSEAWEKDLVERLNAEITDAIRKAEAAPQPPHETLVEDVFAEVPPHLRRQFERR